MDEILEQYVILIIYLLIVCACDILFYAVPMWATLFAFLGRVICYPVLLKSLAFSCTVSLFIFFISAVLSHIKKFEVLGRGDIYIIFIIGLFLDPADFFWALFFSMTAAAVMVIIFCVIMKYGQIPLGPAFLFGTIAAVW